MESARGIVPNRIESDVMMPKTPKLPAASFARSNPATFLTTLPPSRTIWPSLVTKESPTMWSRSAPNPDRSGPAVPVATTDPNVRPLPGGSAESHVPRSASPDRRSSQRIPACAVATWSDGSTWSKRFSCFVVIARSAGASGEAHVPDPSMRICHPAAAAVRTTSAQASSVSGATRGMPSTSVSTAASGPSSERTRRTMLSPGPGTVGTVLACRPGTTGLPRRRGVRTPPATGS